MNNSPTPESGPYSTNQRPFFYARATAQQPFPNPWFLGPMYNPYSMPTTGFRSGNPYYPFYSIPFHEYSGYLVQQPPMHMRVNRRPYFNGHPPSPMFYQATRFRHYSPGKRTETKETQTDPKQLENKQKKHQDYGIETKGRDAANVTCLSSIGKGAESTMEKSDRTVSPTVPEREFPKNSAGSVQFRSLPPPGYAFEKEEVRIEYGNGGAPAIQLWKSVKETIPLYDVAKKPVPENVIQRDVFALSACEGIVYGPHKQGEMVPSIPYLEEQKALDVQKKEQLSRASLDSEKQASHRVKSPLDEAKSAQLAEPTRPDQLGVRQDAQMSKRSSGFKSGPTAPQDMSNLVQQREYFPSGMEITNDSSFPQKHEMTNEHQMSAESLWCDESEKYIPPDSWLACLDNMDANYNYNMYLSQRKRPSVLSLTSDEMSSVDEASVTDKAPASYFVPDYVLQKNMYTFKKSMEGLEREKIKSGGSLNEDEVMGSEQPYASNSQNLKSCSRVKIKDISSRGRKLGILPKSSSKKLYSRKASKSLSPSEAEESDEYWVKEQEDDEDEEEYLIQEVDPYGTMSPSKSGLYRQIGQQVFWRIPKNAMPAQFISLPVQEKLKTSSPTTKLKGQEQDEDLCSDYNFCRKRPPMQLEVLEHRKIPQKFSGRLQKEDGEMAADEYWMKSGAKPKFTSLIHGGFLPITKSREKDHLPVDMLKKVRKPPHKRRDTRHDAEEYEEWEKPKTTQHKVLDGKEVYRAPKSPILVDLIWFHELQADLKLDQV
ncbi:uncharacterized protein [Tiliqua scincoides]|uniref:uncharacterized protein n=1 Tax=Tiliqua scincoides TaxID=71010 RepID=UPI0034627870